MTVHAASVTRTELSLGDLDLINPLSEAPVYDIMADSFDAGRVTWRRDTVTSPYVAGAYEVGAVKDEVDASLVVRVKGTDHTTLQTHVGALIEAFSQSTYTLTLELDSVEWAWTCKRADYALAYDLPMRRRHIARVVLAFPRSPIPAAGPY